MTVILGIDPGTRVTGFALLQQRGRVIRRVDSGNIRLDPRKDLGLRLAQLGGRLEEVLERGAPDAVAVEDVFSHRNARSALLLGHARGVVLATAARHGASVQAYSPASVKQAVTGHGRADKGQMQRMVQVLLSLERLPSSDEADAMAVAICHAMTNRIVASARASCGAGV